ncbi:MAG: hypothetical protein IJ446_08260 [Oscillospiraceae bacterium]|nr:hypothetical protein [Oscillospiraceae bacterium]
MKKNRFGAIDAAGDFITGAVEFIAEAAAEISFDDIGDAVSDFFELVGDIVADIFS